MDISVISLTWNSEKYIDRFIRTLFADLGSSEFEYEVYIIDNGSSDRTLDRLRYWQKMYSHLYVIPLTRNMGTTFSRNIGLRASVGKYIAVLDSDTEIPQGTFGKWINGFKELPSERVGIVAPKLVYPDGELQISARRFPTIASKIARLLGIEWMLKRTDIWNGVVEGMIVPVPYAISAAWLIKREAFEDVGYLDERIFYAPEDAEYCTRMWTKGWEVWYYPEPYIIHYAQRITKKNPLSKMGLKHVVGLLYYWGKYAGKWLIG